MKDHTPIAIHDMFNMSSRDNLLVKLPSVRLNLSQYNFVNRCSLIWNKFIGKVMETNKPESDGTLIQGSAENSDLCTVYKCTLHRDLNFPWRPKIRSSSTIPDFVRPRSTVLFKALGLQHSLLALSN